EIRGPALRLGELPRRLSELSIELRERLVPVPLGRRVAPTPPQPLELSLGPLQGASIRVRGGPLRLLLQQALPLRFEGAPLGARSLRISLRAQRLARPLEGFAELLELGLARRILTTPQPLGQVPQGLLRVRQALGAQRFTRRSAQRGALELLPHRLQILLQGLELSPRAPDLALQGIEAGESLPPVEPFGRQIFHQPVELPHVRQGLRGLRRSLELFGHLPQQLDVVR